MSTPLTVEPRQALYAHLKQNPGVTEAVGQRVFQMTADPGIEPQLVIWPMQSRVPQRDLNGVFSFRARLQVTAIAPTQVEAEKAAKAVRKAVEGFTGLMANNLPIILTEVIDDSQSNEEDTSEVYHHVLISLLYKE